MKASPRTSPVKRHGKRAEKLTPKDFERHPVWEHATICSSSSRVVPVENLPITSTAFRFIGTQVRISPATSTLSRRRKGLPPWPGPSVCG